MDPRDTLIAAATHFYQRGWMLGTAGNLSLRAEVGGFWITASGRHKGALQRDDFVRVSVDGALLEQPNPARKPSAETSIHQAIYQQCADAAAVYHVHSVEANLVSHWHEAGMLALPPLEMIKAFGVWEATPRVAIPVFDNLPHVPDIAAAIARFLNSAAPDLPAILIHQHGATVWGSSAEAALHHVELLEYLFRFMVQARILGVNTHGHL